MSYAPPTVTMGQGDTLIFNNLDTLARHDLVSDEGKFGSALIPGGESAPVEGAEKLRTGHYNFHCTLHTWMHGVVEVARPASTGGRASAGDRRSTGNTPLGRDARPTRSDIWPQATREKIGEGELADVRQGHRNSRNGGRRPARSRRRRSSARRGASTRATATSPARRSSRAGSSWPARTAARVYALDAATGRPLWHAEAGEDPVNGTVAIAGKRVFVPVAEAARAAGARARPEDGQAALDDADRRPEGLRRLRQPGRLEQDRSTSASRRSTARRATPR